MNPLFELAAPTQPKIPKPEADPIKKSIWKFTLHLNQLTRVEKCGLVTDLIGSIQRKVKFYSEFLFIGLGADLPEHV